MSALKAWHILNSMPWNGNIQLKYTLKGADNLTPKASIHSLRPPISRDMLITLNSNLDTTLPLDACVAAAANTAFWAQCRLGKLLSPRARSFDATMNPTTQNLGPATTSAGSHILHLPNTKTHGKWGDDIYICHQSNATDPIAALANHYLINKLSNQLPLFSYLITPTTRLALTKRAFLNCCN
jgi:hypothetical protein